MRRLLIFFVTVSIIISCNSKESAEEKRAREENERMEKEVLREKEKEKKIDNLTWKYNVKYKLDTFRLRYSIEYRPVLESGHLLMEISSYHINDIFQKDSLYYASINPRGTISELILPITKEQSKELLNRDIVHLLVVDINEIKKIRFSFEGVKDGEDISVGLENATGFSAIGKLIEMVSLKKEL